MIPRKDWRTDRHFENTLLNKICAGSMSYYADWTDTESGQWSRVQCDLYRIQVTDLNRLIETSWVVRLFLVVSLQQPWANAGYICIICTDEEWKRLFRLTIAICERHCLKEWVWSLQHNSMLVWCGLGSNHRSSAHCKTLIHTALLQERWIKKEHVGNF